MVNRLTWLAWSSSLVLAVGGYWLLYLDRDTVVDAFDLMTSLSGLAFCTVGLLIVRARPGNRVGWLASVLGFVLVISFFCSEYAIRASLGNGLPLASPIAYLGHFVSTLLLITIALLVLTYPTGTIGGWVWRVATALAVGAWLCFLVSAPFVEVRSWRLVDVGSTPVTEMVLAPALLEGAPPLMSMSGAELVDFGYSLGFIAILAGVVSMAIRYLRNQGLERIQIKWLVYVLVLGFALIGIFLATRLPGVRELGGFALFVGSPVAIGVAITRHGLYEINRVISRTVTYAIVAGLLTGVVAATAALVGAQFRQPWVVAATTMSVAAVFNPLRRRVHRWVDHRFNRSRYDAERVMHGFGVTLQDRVDPEGIVDGWIGVISETMQPASVGVWLRR